MQSNRLIPAAKTPAIQAQRRNERRVEARDDKRSAPQPLDPEQLDRVGGGYLAPKTTW